MLSHSALAPTAHNHFRIEHPYRHHRRVATPDEPQLLRKWVSLFGSLRSNSGGVVIVGS